MKLILKGQRQGGRVAHVSVERAQCETEAVACKRAGGDAVVTRRLVELDKSAEVGTARDNILRTDQPHQLFLAGTLTIASAIHSNTHPLSFVPSCITIQFYLSHLTKMFKAIRFSSRVGLRTVRWNSTSSSVPPLMAKLRSDLKDAMRAKDTPR
jgi:hypothetical protein